MSVLKMTKVERLQYGESLMTHAMVLTGVHIEVSLPFAEELFCGLAFSGSTMKSNAAIHLIRLL